MNETQEMCYITQQSPSNLKHNKKSHETFSNVIIV